MWPYVVLIMLPIVIQHVTFRKDTLTDNQYRRKTKFSMMLFWCMLLVLLLLRHESVGVDIATYKYIYDSIAKGSWAKAIGRSPEIAWSLMNKAVAEMNGEFSWVMILSAIFSVIWMARAYVRYTDDTSLTISLFILMSNFILLFSGLRQAIAISLGFLAFEFVRSKKIVPFLIFTIIAILFHTSAFMLLFMYPLYHVKVRKNWLIVIIPLLMVVWVFNQQIFTFLGFILNRFTDYDTRISKTGSVTMLILFVLFAVFAYVIPEEEDLDDDTLGMRNFLLLSVVIQMFAPLHAVAMRMGYYYIAFIPLLLPRIIRCRSSQMDQVATIARHIMLVFFLVYFFLTAPSDNLLQTFPYRFFWQTG